MADFTQAFNYILTNEDYSPTDPRYGKVHTDNDGGLVRFGVNSNSMGKSLLQTTYYTTMDIPSALLVAHKLYQNNEWKEICGDSITSQRVASKILDMAVNQGSVQANKLVQRAAGVNVDGVIGPITVSAVNGIDETTMLNGLVYWWLAFIEQVVSNKPTDKDYELAWTARAEKLPVN